MNVWGSGLWVCPGFCGQVFEVKENQTLIINVINGWKCEHKVIDNPPTTQTRRKR